MSGQWRVATGHPETTGAAVRALDAGGNAVDAAVGAALAASVVEPVLCSLGGGGFALVSHPRATPRLLDFFVQTPGRRREDPHFYPITGDFGRDTQEFHVGLGSIAVPGVVAGLFELHGRYGRLPLGDTAAPAVRLARHGVLVNPAQAYTLRILEPIVRATREGARVFGLAEPDDRLPQAGDRVTNAPLADFVEQLVREGADLFYRGEPARALAEACRRHGGHLNAGDLRHYAPRWRRPLSCTYRAARLWTNPPPAFGGILVTLATGELGRRLAPGETFGSLAHVQALVRAFRAVNRLRDRLDRAQTRHGQRGLTAAWRELQHVPVSTRGTTHISVRDADGTFVGMTLSNGEGSGHVLPGTGIMLNNMLGEEDLNRGGFHRWPVNRRVASMMAPVLLRHDGRLTMLGTGGSNRIRSALTQVVSNLVDFGMDLSAAVRAPRLHVDGDRVGFEAFAGGYAAEALDFLKGSSSNARGWPEANLYFGGVHAVSDVSEAADARRSGSAAAGRGS